MGVSRRSAVVVARVSGECVADGVEHCGPEDLLLDARSADAGAILVFAGNSALDGSLRGGTVCADGCAMTSRCPDDVGGCLRQLLRVLVTAGRVVALGLLCARAVSSRWAGSHGRVKSCSGLGGQTVDSGQPLSVGAPLRTADGID